MAAGGPRQVAPGPAPRLWSLSSVASGPEPRPRAAVSRRRPMQRALVAVLLGAASFSSLLVEPAHAKLAMEIVYDASGSMWAKVGDKERFLVLNKALDAFLDKVP